MPNWIGARVFLDEDEQDFRQRQRAAEELKRKRWDIPVLVMVIDRIISSNADGFILSGNCRHSFNGKRGSFRLPDHTNFGDLIWTWLNRQMLGDEVLLLDSWIYWDDDEVERKSREIIGVQSVTLNYELGDTRSWPITEPPPVSFHTGWRALENYHRRNRQT